MGSCCGRGEVSSPKEARGVSSVGEGVTLVAGCEMCEVESGGCASCSLADRCCSVFPSGCLRAWSSGSSCSTLCTVSFLEGVVADFGVVASSSRATPSNDLLARVGGGGEGSGGGNSDMNSNPLSCTSFEVACSSSELSPSSSGGCGSAFPSSSS